MQFFTVYLILVNATALLLMHLDKEKAIKGKWRIPERVLLTVAVIGGSMGTLLGMYAFRHKTKHIKFTLCVPLLLFLHFGILFLFIK